MPFAKHTRRVLTLAGVAATGCVIALGWTGAASGSQQTVAGLAQADAAQLGNVKTAFTEAIKADRAAIAPPAAAVGQSANLAAGKAAPMLSASVRQRQLSDGLAALAKHFTPEQAKRQETGLRNAVANEADPKFRNLGSGASKVVFTQVGVSGSTATVQAKVTLWAKFQQQLNGSWITANPVNVMDYTATLVKNSSGQWVVSSLTGDFAPGEAP